MDSIIVIGEKAPEFSLPDIHGILVSLNGLAGRIVVLNFWSALCDWCTRVDQEVSPYAVSWGEQVKVLWIASSDDETRQLIATTATERKLSTVLLDTGHKVADIYGVEITPHFFVVDGEGLVKYQGAWDDITFRRRVASQVYVPRVIDEISQGLVPEITETPAYGCVLMRSIGSTTR